MSKPREEAVHTATIATSAKGDHAPLIHEDEGQADPASSASGGDLEMCAVLVSITSTNRCVLVQHSHMRVYLRRITEPGFPQRRDAFKSLP